MNKEVGLKIKHRLECKGSSFSAVARGLEPPVSPQAVHRVAYLIRSTPRIRQAIVDIIGEPDEDIWGENAIQGQEAA